MKYAEKALTYAAGAAWFVFDKLNQIHQIPGFVPKWSDQPLLKSWEKAKPSLGWPREVGYTSVQAATNGIEFARSPEFYRQAAEAGLRYAYLQFDGIGNAANQHRKVGNLFDVKLRAMPWRAITIPSRLPLTSSSAIC